MDESSLRFQIPKTFDEEKACVINPIPKSTVYKNKWALQIFREWQGQRAKKICNIEAGGVFKREDIGLDVQELTESIENENAKSLNYWLCMQVRAGGYKQHGEWTISFSDALQYCLRLKTLSVEKNGKGALNPLAVSDKRYH